MAGTVLLRREYGGFVDRVAVFVDAGYLFAQGSKELCGQKLERRRISLDHQAAVDRLTEFAEAVSELPQRPGRQTAVVPCGEIAIDRAVESIMLSVTIAGEGGPAK